jgi:hypothetical protein
MESPVSKKDISWIVRQIVLGNVMFMCGSLAMLWCLDPGIGDLIFLALCSLVGLFCSMTIIYSMIFKTLGEQVHPLYLVLALIETGSIFFLGVYMMMSHSC